MSDINGNFNDTDYYAQLSDTQRERASAVEIAGSVLPESYRPRSVSTGGSAGGNFLAKGKTEPSYETDRLASEIIDLARYIETGSDETPTENAPDES